MSAEECDGCYTDTMDATIDVQQAAEAVRHALEKKMKQRFAVYDAIQYRSQVVEGLNYIIKVHVKYEKQGYIHIKVYLPIGFPEPPPKLEGDLANKTLEDPIATE